MFKKLEKRLNKLTGDIEDVKKKNLNQTFKDENYNIMPEIKNTFDGINSTLDITKEKNQ